MCESIGLLEDRDELRDRCAAHRAPPSGGALVLDARRTEREVPAREAHHGERSLLAHDAEVAVLLRLELRLCRRRRGARLLRGGHRLAFAQLRLDELRSGLCGERERELAAALGDAAALRRRLSATIRVCQ